MSKGRQGHSPVHVSSQQGGAEGAVQDWVCVKCNNLNFSFRKKCNRCKVQSREDNQQVLYADYYYYNNYYNYSSDSVPSPPSSPECSPMEDPSSPTPKIPRIDEEAGQVDDHLPSVSPLVKKYSKGVRKEAAGRGLFLWKLFGEESWSEADLPKLTAPFLPKGLCLTDD
jgi:hypothetical protein